MAVISLITDFGIMDEYAGVMKGVILSIDPSARIVDLCHQIPAQDILKASFMIHGSYACFPKGSIHVIVVDPEDSARDSVNGIFKEKRISGIAKSYQDADIMTPLAVTGSRGYLEIAVNSGNAGNFFKAKKGGSCEGREKINGHMFPISLHLFDIARLIS
ncbi:MAG: SAM-dependent chlorinase/fluorinase [Proteobacteria bacterium]|nr:SAM-dependent chlorinase/fluorinase [Pseudomonadota bacterium]